MPRSSRKTNVSADAQAAAKPLICQVWFVDKEGYVHSNPSNYLQHDKDFGGLGAWINRIVEYERPAVLFAGKDGGYLLVTTGILSDSVKHKEDLSAQLEEQGYCRDLAPIGKGTVQVAYLRRRTCLTPSDLIWSAEITVTLTTPKLAKTAGPEIAQAFQSSRYNHINDLFFKWVFM